jgi:hypothetical protein
LQKDEPFVPDYYQFGSFLKVFIGRLIFLLVTYCIITRISSHLKVEAAWISGFLGTMKV